jgi:hypothetical protein
MNIVQKRTIKLARDLIIDTLSHAGEEDEYHEQVMDRCEQAGKIDTSELDVSTLFQDPKVQKALKQFVSGIIGSLQFVEEEFGADRRDRED